MRKFATSTLIGTVSNLFVRDVPGDKPTKAADFTLALHAGINGRSVPAYIPVSAIGPQVEFMLEDGRLKEDANVFVGGEIRQERWTKEGKPMSRLSVRATRLEIADDTLPRTEPDAKQRTHVAQGLNATTIAGNLTAAPEMRKTPAGDSVANFTVALNSKYRNTAGQDVEEVSFIEVIAWRDMADHAFRTLQKGSPVVVQGGLVTNGWTDKDGNKRQSLQLEATCIFKMEGREVTEAAGSDAPEMDESQLPPVDVAASQVEEDQLPF